MGGGRGEEMVEGGGKRGAFHLQRRTAYVFLF